MKPYSQGEPRATQRQCYTSNQTYSRKIRKRTLDDAVFGKQLKVDVDA